MIIVVTGPTASGKTKLSEKLAKKYNGIIVNADSMQIYKKLDIGTAKVKKEEMEDVPHYLFDICNPEDDYSVYDYQRDARKIIENNRDKTIILVGGTGLYIKAALFDYKFEEQTEKNTYDDYQPVISDALSTFFLFICTAAIIAIQNLGFVSVLSKRQIPWVYIILFSILFLSVGIVATIYVIKKKQYELNHTREELQRMESDEGYNKLITQIDTDQKIMIHDIKNHGANA